MTNLRRTFHYHRLTVERYGVHLQAAKRLVRCNALLGSIVV
jgi:hypothetical protein